MSTEHPTEYTAITSTTPGHCLNICRYLSLTLSVHGVIGFDFQSNMCPGLPMPSSA